MRSRISYVFRVYAAVYGHSVTENPAEAALRCHYGRAPQAHQDASAFHLPALYEITETYDNAKLTRSRYAGEEFYLRYGFERTSRRPDWLGEIFDWLSSSYETHVVARDGVGRIPYCETVFHREGVSPRKPHAALLMAWLDSALHGAGEERLSRASSPLTGIGHLVFCSHDIDFYSVDTASVLIRLIKNLAIAARLYQSRSYFLDNLSMIFDLFRGKRVGDYLPQLLALTSECDVKSTLFVVSRRGHRRDPNYRLEQIAVRLTAAAAYGFSIGLHGSYRSINEDKSLREEALGLADQMGRAPLAGRQHWLRFANHRDLFAQVEAAGLLIDSTLGFPDMVGFRNGASFPFPPYDFEREAAHEFLEVPLILMDGSLQSAAAGLHTDALDLAEAVLSESRKVGWGGVGVLWHNPLEPLSVPTEINNVFWTLAKRQNLHREKWTGADELLATILPRYQHAGLLQGARINEHARSHAARA